MSKWIEIKTTVDTVDWKGEPIQIPNVKAFKDPKTNEIMVYPSEVAKAEISQIAKDLDICPRDIATLLMIRVKPGNYNEGEVFYKYHLQKMLFYLWKNMGKVYGDSLSTDHFIAADNGPVPENLDKDLERFEKNHLVRTKCEKWEQGTSQRIILTEEGVKVAEEICRRLPEPYQEIALRVKKRIYPMSPEAVRELVHKEFPEYRDSYIKNDIE